MNRPLPGAVRVLNELVVHNFAIIRHLELTFHKGLHILSGETGAGKSILVGAINLVLGSRASQEMIRTGATEATVETVLTLPDDSPARKRLEGWGIEAGEEVVIRRVVNRSGRSRATVNGQMITLQQLQQLAEGLISVSGQHEHQLLLDPEIHIGLLDAYGDLEPDVTAVRGLFDTWSHLRDKLQRFRKSRQEFESRLDWMRFQIQELEGADIQPGEDTALEQERNILKHAATLSEAARGAYQGLYSGRGAVLEQLAQIEKQLTVVKGIDPAGEPFLNSLEQGRIHLEELSHTLSHYANQITFDPARFATVEDRLALLRRLGKKYGESADAMVARLAELRQGVAEADEMEFDEEKLGKAAEEARHAYFDMALRLSARRRGVALDLAKDVEQALASLDMPRARFSVAFAGEAEDPEEALASRATPTGVDTVEFLLSANPGEELKPLARIASGGELSRILLALKSLLSRKGEAETLVFDEVDTGIGGKTAELVGIQLNRLAGRHQVICITHLPQIASFGEQHYRIVKESTGEETVTRVEALDPEERVEELSRMLGGVSVTDTAREHARELLERSGRA